MIQHRVCMYRNYYTTIIWCLHKACVVSKKLLIVSQPLPNALYISCTTWVCTEPNFVALKRFTSALVNKLNVSYRTGWLWSDGSRLDYACWHTGEHNNYNGKREPCMMMNSGGTVNLLSFEPNHSRHLKNLSISIGDVIFYPCFPYSWETLERWNM